MQRKEFILFEQQNNRYFFVLQEEELEVGDRGNLVVDIPDAVLPYVPKLYTEKGKSEYFFK